MADEAVAGCGLSGRPEPKRPPNQPLPLPPLPLPPFCLSEGAGASREEAEEEAGAEVDLADNQGYTAMRVACMGGRAALVLRLLKAGAGVNLANSQGGTPLHDACSRGRAEVAKLLLDAGADPGEGRRNPDQSLPTMLPGGSPEASTFRDEARSHRDRAGIALGSRAVCVCARTGRRVALGDGRGRDPAARRVP